MRRTIAFLMIIIISTGLLGKDISYREAYDLVRADNVDLFVDKVSENKYNIDGYIDNSGMTMLLIAMQLSSRNIAKWLIANSKGINSPNSYGETPLIIASKSGDTEYIGKLIDAGADVNLPDKSGNIPLHYSGRKNLKKPIDMLLDAGSDRFRSNNLGDMPLHFAISYRHSGNLHILYNYENINVKNSKMMTPVHLSISGESIDVLNQLAELGADFEIPDLKGNRPVHYAARNSDIEFLKKLSDERVDFNSRNRKGMTPLHISFMRNNFRAVQFLLEKGADSTIRDNNNMDIHDYALKNSFSLTRIRNNAYLNNYFLESNRGREYKIELQKLDELRRRKDQRERLNKITNYTIAVGLGAANMGYAVYMRENKYGDRKADNPYGRGLGVGMGAVLGGTTCALGLAYLAVEASDTSGLSQLGPFVIGGVLGLVAGALIGGYYGAKNGDEFGENPFLYYGSTALVSIAIPIAVINF